MLNFFSVFMFHIKGKEGRNLKKQKQMICPLDTNNYPFTLIKITLHTLFLVMTILYDMDNYYYF